MIDLIYRKLLQKTIRKINEISKYAEYKNQHTSQYAKSKFSKLEMRKAIPLEVAMKNT
jgi:tyrosine-protein phosphatase YwqE